MLVVLRLDLAQISFNLIENALAALQAMTILVAMASGKNIWRPKFLQKSQQIKRETYRKDLCISRTRV